MYPQRQCPSPPAPHPSPSGAFPSRPRPSASATHPALSSTYSRASHAGWEANTALQNQFPVVHKRQERSAWPGGVCRPQELVYKQEGVVGGNDPLGTEHWQASNLSRLSTRSGGSALSLGSAGAGVGSVRERASGSAPPSPRPARRPRPQPHHERTHVETQTSFQSSVPSTPTPTPPSPSPPMRPDSPPFPGRARGHPAPHPSAHYTPLYHPLSHPPPERSFSPPTSARKISRRQTLFNYDVLKNTFCLSCPPLGLAFASSMAVKYQHADDTEVSPILSIFVSR